MIVINDFTELKSNPRNGGISAASFGASKFCSHIDAASKLVAVWSDNNSGEELNFKIYTNLHHRIDTNYTSLFSMQHILTQQQFF
ncbi:hypothetical protein [uncultured Campylobacter sp.]|uniref:hypothetical protein n=1 Tax=uncultured Campylobacter sp. TaxID=218934 RepID=UPI00260AFCB5|nr:hypothetical protein [uncultured Campylobacter sp.]